MARTGLRQIAAGSVGLALLGCGATRVSPPAAPATTRGEPSAAPTEPIHGKTWGWVRSTRQGLALPLPESNEWAVNDRQEGWLVAQHAPSRSEIRLRAWRAQRLNSPQDCWRQVRLWRPDFPRLTDTLLERRPLRAPSSYRGEVAVGLSGSGEDQVEGFVVAVGATTGRCFAFWYRTHGRGPGAEATVAENLAAISAGVVDRIEETGIEEAVQREPLR